MMNRSNRPRLFFTGTGKSSLKRPSISSFDSMWLDIPAPSNSSNVLNVLRDLMVANLEHNGNISRSLQEEAAKFRPLLALLD